MNFSFVTNSEMNFELFRVIGREVSNPELMSCMLTTNLDADWNQLQRMTGG